MCFRVELSETPDGTCRIQFAAPPMDRVNSIRRWEPSSLSASGLVDGQLTPNLGPRLTVKRGLYRPAIAYSTPMSVPTTR